MPRWSQVPLVRRIQLVARSKWARPTAALVNLFLVLPVAALAQGSPFDTVTPALVFEAVGVPGIVDDVLLRAKPGTRLVVAGVCMQPDTVHPFFAIAKEINVQFVLAYDPEFADSLRAIAEGDIDVTPVITGDVGLEDVGAAFDNLADPERHCKVLVTR